MRFVLMIAIVFCLASASLADCKNGVGSVRRESSVTIGAPVYVGVAATATKTANVQVTADFERRSLVGAAVRAVRPYRSVARMRTTARVRSTR